MSIEGVIVGLLAVVIGAAWAIYGLKFFTILLPLWAFVFGLAAGAQWSQEIFGQGFFSTVLSWIIGFGFGLFLAVISFFWYYAAVVILGGALGYALGVGLMDWLNIDASVLGILVGLIVGAVFAFATFALGVPVFLVDLPVGHQRRGGSGQRGAGRARDHQAGGCRFQLLQCPLQGGRRRDHRVDRPLGGRDHVPAP